jgi:hypothetical protein
MRLYDNLMACSQKLQTYPKGLLTLGNSKSKKELIFNAMQRLFHSEVQEKK